MVETSWRSILFLLTIFCAGRQPCIMLARGIMMATTSRGGFGLGLVDRHGCIALDHHIFLSPLCNNYHPQGYATRSHGPVICHKARHLAGF